MNPKTKAGPIIGVVLAAGIALVVFVREEKKPNPNPNKETISLKPQVSPLTEQSDDVAQDASDNTRQAPKQLRMVKQSSVSDNEVLPQCDRDILESESNVIQTSSTTADYSGTWAFVPGLYPTVLPCWKDIYIAAITPDPQGPIIFMRNTAPFDPSTAQDVRRIYFSAPVPSPTPTPVATATPIPSPITGVPVCKSGQRIGVPPTCRCLTGSLGNSGKCR